MESKKIHGIKCSLRDPEIISYVDEVLTQIQKESPWDYKRILKRVTEIKPTPWDGRIGVWALDWKSFTKKEQQIHIVFTKKYYSVSGTIGLCETAPYPKIVWMEVIGHEFGHVAARLKDFDLRLYDNWWLEKAIKKLKCIHDDIYSCSFQWIIEQIADYYLEKWGIVKFGHNVDQLRPLSIITLQYEGRNFPLFITKDRYIKPCPKKLLNKYPKFTLDVNALLKDEFFAIPEQELEWSSSFNPQNEDEAWGIIAYLDESFEMHSQIISEQRSDIRPMDILWMRNTMSYLIKQSKTPSDLASEIFICVESKFSKAQLKQACSDIGVSLKI